MANIRDILAYNLKENRKKCQLSQAKLAEKAKITTQYIAMIEVSRKFPTPEMLERLAKALNIETHELFIVEPSATSTLEHLRQDIIGEVKSLKETISKDITDDVINAVKEIISKEYKDKKKK